MPDHNHRPDEGEGLGCPETRVNGVLQGECLAEDAKKPKPRVIGKIVGGVGRAPAQSRVDSSDYYKSVTRVEKEYGMSNNNADGTKDFTFSLVVSAIDLDDAIAQLDAAGHDVDDLVQVRWLD